MPLFAQQPTPDEMKGLFILVVAGAMMLCFVVAWIYLANRATATKSLLPRYEPRRRAPWTGLDLIVIVLFYLSLSVVTHVLLFGWPKSAQAVVQDAAAKIEKPTPPNKPPVKTTAPHPLAQLLKDKDLKILLLCLSVGVVIVPIFEEFFFRVLFTGWLLAVERRWRGKWRRFRPPRAVLPIAVTSLVFASLHIRGESGEIPETRLVLSMIGLAAISIVTMAFAVAWIGLRHSASARDFGWDARKWPDDIGTGACAFFATALPVYALQIALGFVLPHGIPPDPIVLFFFASVLGTLYFRTSRILPSTVMHMLLNAGSLALAWVLM
jgi:membrane protease YdiL (CAAX protease family)